MNKACRALLLLAVTATLLPAGAMAAEPEKVVVRNRKYTLDGKMEAAANVGLTMVNHLTSHTNLSLGLGYNFSEALALQFEGGWALSDHTNVAQAASDEVMRADPATKMRSVEDFEDLWQLTWNATAALRWAPVYGKVNVAAELPVHFKAYVLAGAGAGGMVRDSLVYCVGQPTTRKLATCQAGGGDANTLEPMHQEAVKPVFVGGAGLRLFFLDDFGLNLEVRDVMFQDAYRVKISRTAAETDQAALDGAPNQGQDEGSPGLTHLVFFQAGVTYAF